MTPLLETAALTVRVAGKAVCVGLELKISPGESWALMGRNGVGKTTLLQHLGGLRQDHDGSLRLGGDTIGSLTPRRRARRVALLLQHSSRGFGASVLPADSSLGYFMPANGPVVTSRSGICSRRNNSIQERLREIRS